MSRLRSRRLLSVTVLVFAASSMVAQVARGEDGPPPRIVGGTNDNYTNNQWVTALFLNGSQACGGSLVTRNYVLTAQHCTEHTQARNWRVRVGSKWDNQGGQVRQVKRLYEYPGFGHTGDGGIYGDLALMKLERRVSYKPVKLVPTNAAYVGYSGYISGWGDYYSGDPQAHHRLQRAWVPILHDSDCAGLAGYRGSDMICAGAPYVADTCQGDSGGPLAVYVDNRWQLVGVTSWGYGCAGETPGAYAWVGATTLRNWLYRRLGGR